MIKTIGKLLFPLLAVATALPVPAQTLTLEQCYDLAKQNYPLSKQKDLIRKSKEYTIANISRGYLPQFGIKGQATYQSDVTQLPIRLPGIKVPAIDRDQYRIFGEVTQTLYDGGLVKHEKQLKEADARAEEQKVEVELYSIRERVNQLYFGVLLIEEQLKQTALVRKDIQLGITKTQASINNGTALKSSLATLKAALLKVSQGVTELKATKKAYAGMLGLFINQQVKESTVFVRPAAFSASPEINRPELSLYHLQGKSLDVQDRLLISKNIPKVSLFVQGGFGRPALNMLSNKFNGYYIGGIRLSWSLSGLYTLKKDKALIDIKRKSIDIQKATFLLNINLALKQQDAQISKYRELLQSDEEIIALRLEIKNTASAQLENGVINSTDFLREVNAEDQARQSKILHEIQLLLAQYSQKTTSGN